MKKALGYTQLFFAAIVTITVMIYAIEFGRTDLLIGWSLAIGTMTLIRVGYARVSSLGGAQ